MEKPKLRPVETQWVQHEGQPVLLLRDPLQLTDKSLMVPAALAAFLALCDGTRDLARLRAAFTLRTGIAITPDQTTQIVGQLDEALLLESALFELKRAEAVASFRAAPLRQPALAGPGYPEQPESLRKHLDEYLAACDGHEQAAIDDASAVRGLISPHIDYQRGGAVYAKAWLPVAESVRSADLVVLLGTDHHGGLGRLTLTRQHYSTPWGRLPTAAGIVDELASALGEEAVFCEELHHIREHSIELASVWLHYMLRNKGCELLPILCGSFQHFVEGADPDADEAIGRAVEVIRAAAKGRKVLYVAAADLAHVGPAFGDRSALGEAERQAVETADAEMLRRAATGSAQAFFEFVREERDRRRICGLPPIYMLLRLLDGVAGQVTAYAQCPADEQKGSWVSIAGVAYRPADPAQSPSEVSLSP